MDRDCDNFRMVTVTYPFGFLPGFGFAADEYVKLVFIAYVSKRYTFRFRNLKPR